MPDQRIARYIRENRDKYTAEALREQLLAAGHPADEIDAALADAQEPRDSTTWRQTLGRGRFWFAYVGYMIGFIGGSYVLSSAPQSQGLGPVFLLAALAVGLWVALSTRFEQTVRRAVGCAMVTLIAVPIVFLVGLYAYCLVTQTSLPS